LRIVRKENKMANIPSVAKRARQAEKRRIRNSALRAELRTARKKIAKVIEVEDLEAVKTLLPGTIKLFDKMVSKNILHKNTAARYKSRLMRRVHTVIPGHQLTK
jgi:small subunit ribosomal protein S20